MAFNFFSRRRTALLAAAALVALVLVGLFIVVASGAEDDSDDPMDVEPGTLVASPSPPPSPSTTTPPTGSQGPGTRGSTLPRVPAGGDPDRPVSSEDPAPPPRPAPSPPDDGIDSFEDCARAGYPIAESYPEQCFTPDGRSFTRSIP